MTTPSERTRALRWGAELLGELAEHAQSQEVDRQAAKALLEAYPHPELVLRWIASNVDAITADATQAIEGAGVLLRSLQAHDRCPVELRQFLLYTLRHFPPLGEASSWGNPRSRQPIGSWLLPEDFYDQHPAEGESPTADDVLKMAALTLEGSDWLDRKHPVLGYRSPRELLATAKGRQCVMDLLGAIRYGIPP